MKAPWRTRNLHIDIGMHNIIGIYMDIEIITGIDLDVNIEVVVPNLTVYEHLFRQQNTKAIVKPRVYHEEKLNETVIYVVKILEQSKRPKLAVLEDGNKQVLITKTAGKLDLSGEKAATTKRDGHGSHKDPSGGKAVTKTRNNHVRHEDSREISVEVKKTRQAGNWPT